MLKKITNTLPKRQQDKHKKKQTNQTTTLTMFCLYLLLFITLPLSTHPQNSWTDSFPNGATVIPGSEWDAKNSWEDARPSATGQQPERPPGLFDFNPPVVETLSISPTVLNVQQEEQYVTVICRVSDDFSGVAKVEVELSGRMGSDQASVSRSANYVPYDPVKTGSTDTSGVVNIDGYLTPVGATNKILGEANSRHKGIWQLKKLIPVLAANGTWLVSAITVTDFQRNSRSYTPAEIDKISNGAASVEVLSGLCFTSPWLCEDPEGDPAAYSPLVGYWEIDINGRGLRDPAYVANEEWDKLCAGSSPEDLAALPYNPCGGKSGKFGKSIADDCTGSSGSSTSDCKGAGLNVVGLRQVFGKFGPVDKTNCRGKLNEGVTGNPMRWWEKNELPGKHQHIKTPASASGEMREGTPDMYDCYGEPHGDYRKFVYAEPLQRRAVQWPQLHNIPAVRTLQELVRQDDERQQKQEWLYSYYRRKWSNTPYCHRIKPDFSQALTCSCHKKAVDTSEQESTVDEKNAARKSYLIECANTLYDEGTDGYFMNTYPDMFDVDNDGDKSEYNGIAYTPSKRILVTKKPTESKACRCDLAAFDMGWEDFVQIDEICYKMIPMFNQPTEVCINQFCPNPADPILNPDCWHAQHNSDVDAELQPVREGMTVGDVDPYHDSLYEHGGGIDDDSVNEANENAEGFMIQDIRPQPFDFLYNKEKYHHPESDYDGSGHLLQYAVTCDENRFDVDNVDPTTVQDGTNDNFFCSYKDARDGAPCPRFRLWNYPSGSWKTNPRRYADVLGCQDKTTGLRCDHKNSRPNKCPESRYWDAAADKYVTRIINPVTGLAGWSTAAEWNSQKVVFAQHYRPCSSSSDCGGIGNVPGTGDVLGTAIPYDTSNIECANNVCSRL